MSLEYASLALTRWQTEHLLRRALLLSKLVIWSISSTAEEACRYVIITTSGSSAKMARVSLLWPSKLWQRQALFLFGYNGWATGTTIELPGPGCVLATRFDGTG
jgi:hypothetical protein